MHIGMKVVAAATVLAMTATYPSACEKRTYPPTQGEEQCTVKSRNVNSKGALVLTLDCGGKKVIRSHTDSRHWPNCIAGAQWPECAEY